jgi:exopolyphosphatase / guanosine-5'-triphosphate,3'-diphosphate pyrophosphatase
MQIIAAIDVGSNAIRMVVGRVSDDQQVEIIDSTRVPVRLGQDTFMSGQIGESAMQAAVDTFDRFRLIANQFGVAQMRAVATSSMREAENSDILIDRIARRSGIQLEIISGEEEARLIHLAVTKAVDLKDKDAILIDIGGGSVEVTISHADEITWSESYPIGTVRLLQRLGENDGKRPFTELLREYTESARHRIDRELGSNRVDLCIGTGGNIDEIGSLRKKFLKGESDTEISLDELKLLIDKLSDMDVGERISKFYLRPDRADVILPAAMVLHMIARVAHAKNILIPAVGLKDGVLWDIAPLAIGPRLPRREQAWSSAIRLGHKYQVDEEHGTHVAKLAGRIFDQTLSLHSLDEGDRLLIEIASLLHDIGHFINTLNHDQHGYYILKQSPLMGLDERQQDIIANVVRFHRKFTPSSQDENFKALPQKDRLLVTKLSAILRLADGLDTSHTGRVRDIALEKHKDEWVVLLQGDGDMVLEKWQLAKRKSLFQEVFGVDLKLPE